MEADEEEEEEAKADSLLVSKEEELPKKNAEGHRHWETKPETVLTGQFTLSHIPPHNWLF